MPLDLVGESVLENRTSAGTAIEIRYLSRVAHIVSIYRRPTRAATSSRDKKERPRRLPTRYRATLATEPTTVFDAAEFHSE